MILYYYIIEDTFHTELKRDYHTTSLTVTACCFGVVLAFARAEKTSRNLRIGPHVLVVGTARRNDNNCNYTIRSVADGRRKVKKVLFPRRSGFWSSIIVHNNNTCVHVIAVRTGFSSMFRCSGVGGFLNENQSHTISFNIILCTISYPKCADNERTGDIVNNARNHHAYVLCVR